MAVEDPVFQTEDQCSRDNRSFAGTYLWLENFLGFKPIMIMFEINNRLITVTFIGITWKEYSNVPFCPSVT